VALFHVFFLGLNLMMNALVEASLFSPFSVGVQGIAIVSHFQFRDDNLLIGDTSWANVRALQCT